MALSGLWPVRIDSTCPALGSAYPQTRIFGQQLWLPLTRATVGQLLTKSQRPWCSMQHNSVETEPEA